MLRKRGIDRGLWNRPWNLSILEIVPSLSPSILENEYGVVNIKTKIAVSCKWRGRKQATDDSTHLMFATTRVLVVVFVITAIILQQLLEIKKTFEGCSQQERDK